MSNKKIINKNYLLHNLLKCKKMYPNICAMVKANAYGHGMIDIVKVLKDKVSLFGVANSFEGITLRKMFADLDILVVGKAKNFSKLIKNDIAITIDSLDEAKQISSICQKLNQKAKIHVAVNTGMNRIGVKALEEFKDILQIIKQDNNMILSGVFTHVFDADLKNNHFYEQMKIFHQFVKHIYDKHVLIHIGGSYALKHKIPSFVNMVRIGYFLYGYGMRGLKPVMQIESRIIKLIDGKEGEYVGYGNKTKLKQNTKIAVVPMGYADGLNRRLSNAYNVRINSKKCPIIGNICMDMFMIDVTNTNCKMLDNINVMDNAVNMAKIVDTSPYEILTSFNQLRE